VRVRGGEPPLDASACIPNATNWSSASPKTWACGGVADRQRRAGSAHRARAATSAATSRITLDDICAELLRPGRDPREEFQPPKFRDDVRTLEDLKPGMALEGVVTNVTAFGAFRRRSACTKTLGACLAAG